MYQCLGIESYSDEIDHSVRSRVALTDSVEASFGHRELDKGWEDFYEEASSSTQIFAVKTHRLPRDTQKAIYVVRDGRQALVSYYKFHQEFLGNRQLTLLSLILGLDFYGGWSEHYESWVNNRPNTLLIRFEDLVRCKKSTIEAFADYLGHSGDLHSWDNPFNRLSQNNPNYFREGKLRWEKDAIWNDFLNGVFFQLHGYLMEILGYTDDLAIAHAIEQIPSEAQELIALVKDIVSKNRELNQVCDERQKVIDGLKMVCDDRLTLIQQMSG